MVLSFIFAYVLIQLLIGAYLSRRVESEEDYLVAGRSLGPLLSTATVFATWFGAETCVGAAGEVFTHGWNGAAADPFGYGFALILFGVFIAGPLWRAKITTIADLFRERTSPVVEKTAALLMIPGSVLWASAQVLAFGTVVASVSDSVSKDAGVAVAALVTITYTAMGGLLAAAWTDLLQGGILVLSLVVLGITALATDGGALSSAWSLPTPEGGEATILVRVEAWAIPIVGSLFAQELAARAAASRSGRLAVGSAVGGGIFYVLIGLVPVGLGLMARVLIPELSSGEAALPMMAERYLGSFGQAILVGALVSAILSTIDGALLSASALLTHNLGPALGIKADVRSARVGVVALGLTAWGLAYQSESVHELVEEASAFGSAGFVVAGLGILYRTRAPAWAAMGALLMGGFGYGVARFLTGFEAPFLLSVLTASLGWLVGTALSRWRSESGA